MIELPMTDEQFARARERLARNDIHIAGSSGKLSKDGITASYEHTGGILRVAVVDKPFLLPESLIEGQLRSYLQKAIAEV